jgi:predicted O-methyltransferase YrrM
VLPAAEKYDLAIANFQCEEGWLRPTGSYSTDLISLCQLCHCLRPKRIFEIGTLRGYTALHMAMNSGPDCKIHTLDLRKDENGKPNTKLRTTLMDDIHCQMAVNQYYFSGTPYARSIEPLFGDSAVFDFSPYHGKIDLFFIDGAHSYDYVRSDSEKALKCVRSGGVIAWHDFGRVGLNEVSKYILELSRSIPIYSVPGGSLAFAVV